MVTAVVLALAFAAAPPLATRAAIIERAKPAVGYSYYWGGGCWRTDGAQHGSCSGNCPDCTHSGTYGADCSGYVFKAWQIDGAQPVSECGHGPYTANSYHSNQTHWTHINRTNAQKADILASTTHVVIIESGDPWGSPMILEARGCSYGIQRNARSLGSTYNASERDNLGAPPPPDYKATFVSQTFPLASEPAIVLLEGESIEGELVLKNNGANNWNAQTKLAPTPRDQPSPLADATWLSPTRVVSAGQTVPGSNATFAFTLRGDVPGHHVQTFGLVQESVTWFADSGGPADDVLAVNVRVLARDHAASLVSDGFDELARDESGALLIAEGTTIAGWVEVRNDGHITWDDGIRLAPTPRDQPSALAASSWMSTKRVASPDAATAEGEVARFTFEITGAELGEVTQTFGLVHESVTWFADAGYGPADDFFTLRVKVVPEAELPVLPDDVDDPVDLAAGKRLPPSVESGCAQTGPSFAPLSLCVLALISRRAAGGENSRRGSRAK